MYKSKKKTALFLALIIMLTFVVNPISTVYGSAPKITPKLPVKTPENPTESGIKQQLPTITPKLPEITISGKITKSLEQPARAQGVNYEVKENVKRLSKGM